jgi:hypothetical protein
VEKIIDSELLREAMNTLVFSKWPEKLTIDQSYSWSWILKLQQKGHSVT